MTNSRVFSDRVEAGRLLAEALTERKFTAPVVLALPRGGVPVAVEVGRRLRAPVDLVLVRKIGVPYHRELAAGAVVDGGDREIVYNDDVLAMTGLKRAAVDELAEHELEEIERRRRLYFKDRRRPAVAGQTAIVVDDGLATGATARAALHALRRKNPKWLVLAVPVAPSDTLKALAAEADETICLSEPFPFYAIGAHHRDFTQVSDDEVVSLLTAADDLVNKDV